MTIYSGIVKHNQILLEGDVQLADGVRVEVRPQGLVDAEPTPSAAAEKDFLEHLRTAGLLLEGPTPMPAHTELDRTPIEVSGEPLSQTIIIERR